MIAGMMAICRFPYFERCLRDLLNYVDKVYLRFDGITGDTKIYDRLPEICGDKLGGIYVSSSYWNAFIWREELIRMLDDVKPGPVLFPDEDECFGKGFDKDLERFCRSEKMQMAFHYQHPAPSIDGWKHKKAYPSNRHVKVFKWIEGLTYMPYKKRARLSNWDKDDYFKAKSKMTHYCFYTPELRKNKLWDGPAKKEWFRKEARKVGR